MEFLNGFQIEVIVGICLCLGYVIKKIKAIPDRFIPLIMAVVGVGINLWLNAGVSPQILLGGMFSGLASTGLHQAFKQIVEGSDDD